MPQLLPIGGRVGVGVADEALVVPDAGTAAAAVFAAADDAPHDGLEMPRTKAGSVPSPRERDAKPVEDAADGSSSSSATTSCYWWQRRWRMASSGGGQPKI